MSEKSEVVLRSHILHDLIVYLDLYDSLFQMLIFVSVCFAMILIRVIGQLKIIRTAIILSYVCTLWIGSSYSFRFRLFL